MRICDLAGSPEVRKGEIFDAKLRPESGINIETSPQILQAVGMSPAGAVLLTFNLGDECERAG